MGEEICRRVVVVIPGVAIHPRAICDAEEIYAYLASHNPAVARRFNAAVADTAIAVRDDPALGIAWLARQGRLTDLRWKRVRGFKNYLLFYRTGSEGVVIVRILHGARDMEAILE